MTFIAISKCKPKYKTLTIATILLASPFAAGEVELSGLVSDKLWSSSVKQLTTSQPELDWKVKANVHTVDSDDLKFWGKDISALKLIERGNQTNELKVEILNHVKASKLERSAMLKIASTWKSLLDGKLGSAGITIPSITINQVKHTRAAWKTSNHIVILSANIGDLVIPKAVDKKAIRKIAETTAAKEAILKRIDTIIERKPPLGIDPDVQKAVNTLNIYRFLSGVPSNVVADKDLSTKATDAALICKKKDTLAHDLGHSTDKCNLALNTGGLTMSQSVPQYFVDNGKENRAERGHRKWCLNHKMGKTGFGVADGGFSAMFIFDFSGKGIKKNYSYPGHGFYPIKYLHGNGWSYHLAEGEMPEKCDVQVWKLAGDSDRLPSWSSTPNGTELSCDYISTNRQSVVFEPESEAITETGNYLVRISGKGLKEQYLVKLF